MEKNKNFARRLRRNPFIKVEVNEDYITFFRDKVRGYVECFAPDWCSRRQMIAEFKDHERQVRRGIWPPR